MSTYEQRLGAWGAAQRLGPSTDPRETQRIINANPKPVAIVATSPTFQVGGRPVDVGGVYTVDATTAGSLIALGKAKLA